VLVYLVWFVLGFLFYATAYAGVASLVSRQEDVSSATAPIYIFLIAAYVLVSIVVPDPGGIVSTVVSILPPFAPILMSVRMATGDATAWQVGLAIALIVVPSYPLSAKHSRAASSTALRVSVLPGRRPAGDTMHPPRRVGSGRDANDRELRYERFAQVAVRDQLTLSFDENSRAIGAELSNVRLRSHLIEDDLLGNRTFPADLGGFDIELDERRRNGFPGSVELCSNRVLAGRPKSAAMLVEPTFGAFIGGVPPDRDRGPGSQYSYDLARCAIEVNPVPRLSEGHEVEGSVGERKLVGVGEHRRDAGRARPQTGQHVATVIDGHDPGAAL